MLAQLLEMRESLIFITTNSYQSKSAISNNYTFVDAPVLFSCKNNLDPCITSESLIAPQASLVDSRFTPKN